jgi:hypothetical protein
MKTLKEFSDLHYVGLRKDAQLNNKSKTQSISFTVKQNELYSRLLNGLSIYSSEELYKMNSAKKAKIVRNSKTAQQIINLFKQEVLIHKTNSVLKSLFIKEKDGRESLPCNLNKAQSLIVKKNSIETSEKKGTSLLTAALVKSLLFEENIPDPSFKCDISFKELGLNKKNIADKLIQEKLLPLNFYQL